MELLKWHDSFSVGIKLVNQQHQKLFSLINELIVQTRDDQQKKILTKYWII
jgi:hemerythrin